MFSKWFLMRYFKVSWDTYILNIKVKKTTLPISSYLLLSLFLLSFSLSLSLSLFSLSIFFFSSLSFPLFLPLYLSIYLSLSHSQCCLSSPLPSTLLRSLSFLYLLISSSPSHSAVSSSSFLSSGMCLSCVWHRWMRGRAVCEMTSPLVTVSQVSPSKMDAGGRDPWQQSSHDHILL